MLLLPTQLSLFDLVHVLVASVEQIGLLQDLSLMVLEVNPSKAQKVYFQLVEI